MLCVGLTDDCQAIFSSAFGVGVVNPFETLP
jgi:hypothetical protein